MIPTLFGVTVVSFVVMQLAPGDPQLIQLSSTGTTGESTETRDAFLIRKRDLKLDKPLVLNFNYFGDYSGKVLAAAYFESLSKEALVRRLSELAEAARAAEAPAESETAARLQFLRSLGIDSFEERLADPAKHERLAKAILHYVMTFCEDNGIYSVPAVIDLLRADDTSRKMKIGAVRCLGHMVVEPFQYTYSSDPDENETPAVQAVWKRWWELAGAEFPELDAARRAELAGMFADLLAEESRTRQFRMIEQFRRNDMPFFLDELLGESSLDEKAMAAATLKLYVGRPLQLDVPPDVDGALVREVSGNWLLHYRLHPDQYSPGLLKRIWHIVADTQYAHMVWRLVTFQFGRSAVKTREPVAGKIWDAVLVSAPLMLMAELVIYFVAVPLGILCAVRRGKLTDRLISLGLFFLYSIPPFVAGMLFLMFLCYGDYVRWFPMLGLHSEDAGSYTFLRYMLDYFWHAALPVTCLSLFSLAGMAMYSRTSMLDVIGQDYIRTARAKGLTERRVIFKHAFRNSLIPIITLFSSFLPMMLGGSVLIEWLFGIPGMGRLGFECILLKDFPTLMALIYIDAIVVMLSILVTDLLYVVVDPRISFHSQGQSA